MGVNVGKRSSSSLPRRAYYPSGPWINGVRPPEPSASETTEEKPAKPRKKRPPAGNPDPSNYLLVKAEELPGYLIVMIKYPDCTNYEGAKILVFRGVTLVQLVNQKLIDPHFFINPDFESPIARFVPTVEGWEMALKFVSAMTTQSASGD